MNISEYFINVNSLSVFNAIILNKPVLQYRLSKSTYAPAQALFDFDASLTFDTAIKLKKNIQMLDDNEATRKCNNLGAKKYIDNWLLNKDCKVEEHEILI